MKKYIFYFFLIFCSSKQFAQNVCFNLPVNYPADPGHNPQSIICDDFDNDGKLDLVTADMSVYRVSFFGGLGTGVFAPQINYNSGSYPYFITSSDFNSDGKKDVAMARIISGGISVHLGIGTGSFSAASNYSTANANPIGIISGDYNGDGKLDLAVASSGTSNVSVFLNAGSGTFSTATNYSLANPAVSYCNDDFNGDGKSDLVLLMSPNIIALMLANSSNSFNPPVNYTLSPSAARVISGDFNSDGKNDLVVTHTSPPSISCMLGTGTGSFLPVMSSAITVTVPGAVGFLNMGDFNSDGKPDLVCITSNTNAAVSFILGSGTGNFTQSNSYSINPLPSSITSGDFNNDGRRDVAVCRYNTTEYIIFMNCLGVDIYEKAATYNQKIYPNPNDGEFTLKTEENSSVIISNTLGQNLISQRAYSGENAINLKEYPNGIYIVTILSDKAELPKQIKVIKQ